MEITSSPNFSPSPRKRQFAKCLFDLNRHFINGSEAKESKLQLIANERRMAHCCYSGFWSFPTARFLPANGSCRWVLWAAPSACLHIGSCRQVLLPACRRGPEGSSCCLPVGNSLVFLVFVGFGQVFFLKKLTRKIPFTSVPPSWPWPTGVEF